VKPLWLKPHFLCIVILLSFGCAVQRSVDKTSLGEKYPPPAPSFRQETALEKDPFQGFPEKYYLEAIKLERSGEFPKTLFYWRVVQSFTSNDQEASEKALLWETRILREAENHFLKGLEHFKQNSVQEARKEFLIALAYNPEHNQALDYLKHKLNEPVWTMYEVKKGDTMRKISQEIYKDPEKEFLIAYFNNLDSRNPLRPGMALKIPILAPAGMPKKVPPEEMPPKTPVPSKPLKLDAALQEQSDVHYARGMKYFLSEELAKAIEQWEETLRIYPNHPNAKRDLQRARNLLKNLRKLP